MDFENICFDIDIRSKKILTQKSIVKYHLLTNRHVIKLSSPSRAFLNYECDLKFFCFFLITISQVTPDLPEVQSI